MPRRRWIPWTVAGILLLAVLVPLVGYGAHQLGYLGGKGYFYMPKVAGESLSSAEATLRKDGLNTVATAKEDSVLEGTVLSTDPGGGQQVRKGQTVGVLYSSGPGKIPVAGVVDDLLPKAEAAILAEGLKYDLRAVTPTVGEQLNLVFNTDPLPNTPVLPGTYVTLFYYSGVPMVTVPKGLSGETVTEAQTKILNAHLQFGSQILQLSSTIKAGLVIGTYPVGGTSVRENSVVSLYVSEGPGVTVPSVQGQNYLTAEGAITTAGLIPVVQFKLSSVADKNIVLAETPRGGTQQAPGTTITLVVGQGPLAKVTVTSPGSQSSTANTAITPLSIIATDSAGNSLAFSATDLPPGLSISPSGQITGTPTTPGSYSVTVTATDTTTGASASTTFQWTVTASPPTTT